MQVAQLYPTEEEKVAELVAYLRKRPKSEFKAFLQALLRLGYDELVEVRADRRLAGPQDPILRSLSNNVRASKSVIGHQRTSLRFEF